MARTRANDELDVGRSRVGATWVATGAAVFFLIILVIFIAQNGRHVPVHFLGWKGSFSLAVALLVAAVGGALIVLLIGTVRILQLRLAAHRHRRLDRHQRATPSVPATGQVAEPEDTEAGARRTRP